MAKIPLSGKNGDGKYAIVDDCDEAWIREYTWHLTSPGYVATGASDALRTRYGNTVGLVFMHRLVANAPIDLDVDHINMDRLDNRRSNLRAATRSQNMANAKSRRGSRCVYKGVTRSSASSERWRASITIDGNKIDLGSFATQEKAAVAYNRAAIEAFGNFARINEIAPARTPRGGVNP